MVRNYRQLWNDVASAANEAQAIQTLARILADKEGRFFITLLDGQDADSCTEILGNVSHDLHLPYPLPSDGSSGHHIKRSYICREAYFLPHIEETRRASRATTRSHEDY